MALHFDAAALAHVARERARRAPDAVLIVTIGRIAARGSVHTLELSWSRRHKAERTAVLVPAPPVGDVPVYVHVRLDRYLRWHDVQVLASRCLWRERLVVSDEIAVLVELAHWEFTHPGMAANHPAVRSAHPSSLAL